METSEFAVKKKDSAIDNLYSILQIKEAVGCLQIFFKIDLLKNFANFTKKNTVSKSLFNKVVGLQKFATLLKRDSSTDVFL